MHDEPGEPPEGPWGRGRRAPSYWYRWRETCRVHARDLEFVFTKQQRIAELARNCPDMALTTLDASHRHRMDARSHPCARTRKDGAVGVDGQNRGRIREVVNLEANLQNSSSTGAAKSNGTCTWRRPRAERTWGLKAGSPTETRPLGILHVWKIRSSSTCGADGAGNRYTRRRLSGRLARVSAPGRGAHGALQSLWNQEDEAGGRRLDRGR